MNSKIKEVTNKEGVSKGDLIKAISEIAFKVDSETHQDGIIIEKLFVRNELLPSLLELLEVNEALERS